MRPTDSTRGDRSLVVSIVTLALVLLALAGAFLLGRERASRGLATPLEAAFKKTRLIADMRAHLLTSADAEKAAVMAETDEESRALAADSTHAAAVVEERRTELGRMIETERRVDELNAFRELSACWTNYQEVNRAVLALAVDHSNIKAQKLSFGPARDALVRMRVALDTLVAGAGALADADATATSAYRALTAALEIHVLESRHIASPSDDEMDGIEADMRTLHERVTDGLRSFGAARDEERALVEAARSAYADFQKVNAEVLVLSRGNTDVRSLAMSLGRKRKLTAECLARLGVLQEAVQMDDKATR